MHAVTARLRAFLCTLALVCLGLAGAAPPTAGAAPADSPLCAWRYMSNSTVLNVAFPDANATYWVLPYALGPNTTLELSGTYPAARYFSLNTYGTDFNTVDTLRDNQIVPDPGSVNPFSTAAPAGVSSPAPANRRWHATVVPGPADHAHNQIRGLPAAPGTAPIGFRIIRVYVPDDPNSAPGGVALPEVTARTGGGASLPMQPCGAAFDPASYHGPIAAAATSGFDGVIAKAASGAFPGNVPEATFVNPASTSGLFPNGDNKYIGAGLTYQPGRVVVVRGKAPTFPNTRAGQSATDPDQQVRYWSMCQNDMVSPYPVVACASDFQTRLDAAGYYTYVVAAPADLPASTSPTVTVIPWGATTVAKKVLFLRYMLPTPAFYPQSIQASQTDQTDPAATMGPYYPRAAYCSAQVFASGGYQACGLH